MTETGVKKENISGKGFDTSLYADCFVALGLGKFAALTDDIQEFERTLKLYYRIRERIKVGDIRTEPYPIPKGYRVHSIPMIMLNVAQKLTEAAKQCKHRDEDKLYEHSIFYMKDIIDNFYQEEDSRFGGLLRFTDKNGVKPEGSEKSSSYEQLIIDSWDMKLWWPHSEALYATLLSFILTKDKKVLQQYEKVENYVFETFLNPDKRTGEWIQIRDRKGEPIDKVAALPVKDPFHILRNMLLIIDLLEDEIEANEWI